jgi:cytosine/adenosine deaminase-related metal-dependent hydrolase
MRAAPEIQILRLAGAADGFDTRLGQCCAVLEIPPLGFPAVTLLAIGSEAEVRSHPAASSPDAIEVDASHAVAIPGLVNAHTHLDLTHIGTQPYLPEHSFIDWVDMIRSRRETSPEAIRDSVQAGIEKSLRGGVVAVGDIAGVFGLEPLRVLVESPLSGMVGIELFGIGSRQQTILGRMGEIASAASELAGDSPRVNWTWQPHAPYSVGPSIYQRCARECGDRGVPMMTHLAETEQEAEFVAHGTGPQVDLLRRLGAWDDTCTDSVGLRQSPVEYLSPILAESRSIVAHVNQASDADIEALARAGSTVAYCPRASAYFRQTEAFGAHRYRDMLDAGVNVALGTDSIVNLPDTESERLSTLDDARLLVRRDGLSPRAALAMATWRGAEALGMAPEAFSLAPVGLPRRLAGFGLVPVSERDSDRSPASRVMASERPPALVRPTRVRPQDATS